MSLIEKLNALATLSPDEIAQKIAPAKLFYLNEITPEQHETVANQPCVVFSYDYDEWVVVSGNRHDWTMWMSFTACREEYGRGWAVMLKKDYTDGFLPDRKT